MVLKHSVVVLALLVAACGRDSAAEAQEYLDKFEKDAARHGLDVETDIARVVFVERFSGVTIGRCLGDRTIELSKLWWNRHSKKWREVLVYHELGHCVLGQGHRNGRKGPLGFYSSLMHSTLLNGDVYQAYESYYLKELFSAD